ncbi:uncharacterized protein LOC115761752 [Drosophila novamexicana]|uniref:uncharacterized protein LOC115761752 n=1 Tax=Drosophila novamexicana TaxID=47314 RepID=UPI0011E5A3A9|nr:uncharacterized protein LOC115761752 [Drosophila novamexicana]
MKHQQVVVDYWTMLKTSALCILLAITGFIFLRMVQTIFWLPKRFKQNQERLEAIAKQYGKDMDPEERAEIEKIFDSNEPLTEEQINKLLEGSRTAGAEPKKQQ